MQIRKTFTYGGREHTVVYTRKRKESHLFFDGIECEDKKETAIAKHQYVEAEVLLGEDLLGISIFGRRIYVLKDGAEIETGQPFDSPAQKSHSGIWYLWFSLFLIGPMMLRDADVVFHGEPVIESDPAYFIIAACAIFLMTGAVIAGVELFMYLKYKPLMKKPIRIFSIVSIFVGMPVIHALVFLAYGALVYGKIF